MNRMTYEVWFKVPDNCTDSGWDDMSQVINDLVDRYELEVVTSYNTERVRYFQLEQYKYDHEHVLTNAIREVADRIGADLRELRVSIQFNVDPNYPDL